MISRTRLGLLLGVAAAVSGCYAGAPAASTIPTVTTPPASRAGDPPGANDWTCRPTASRPDPVVLVHGTFGNRRSLLVELSIAVKAAGFCVYSLDYGDHGTGEIAHSAHELKHFVDRVLASTGAAEVSLVGHSQGGMMPRYYIKDLGGADVVDDLVGLAPSNHGTTLSSDAPDPTCEACREQAYDSPFLRALNRGDETPGPVSYTQIETRDDQVVKPFTSAFLRPGPRTTNILLQDKCPTDKVDHIQIPTDPVAIQWVLDALRRPGPADPAFTPDCGSGASSATP